MSQNILGKSDLGYFYENRKKFDDVISNLMGPQTHLHDISADSGSQDQIDSSFGMANKVSSLKSISKSKYDDVHNSFENSNKMQKLYKTNIQLQNKVMNLKQQLQNNKHKAEMWDQTKKYITQNIHPLIEMKSIRFKSSDTALLNQFFVTMEQILADSQKKIKFSSNKDHTEYEETIEKLRKKVEVEAVQNSRISLEKQKLMQENSLLQEKINMIGESRKIRYSQIEESLDERFAKIQMELDAKRQENNKLREQIKFLQSSMKSQISVSSYDEQEKNQYEMIKKISKLREEEIKTLQAQSTSNQSKLFQIRNELEKYKSAFFYAKQLNDDFMKKIEQIAKKDHSKNVFSSLSSRTTNSKATNEYYGDSGIFNKSNEVELPKKTRFKIVKSKSLSKDPVRSRGERYI